MGFIILAVAWLPFIWITYKDEGKFITFVLLLLEGVLAYSAFVNLT